MISADFAYRHFIHLDVGGVGRPGIDLNQYNSIHGPVIAKCSGSQRNDAQAICSLGSINVHVAPARVTYKGLLLRAEKRLSKGFQLLGRMRIPLPQARMAAMDSISTTGFRTQVRCQPISRTF